MTAPARADALKVKICGLKQAEEVACACAAGASYLGFVFVARSPRAVTAAEAREAAAATTPGVRRVGLFVDASDAELAEAAESAGLDMLQLHGAESPERVADVRARFGLPVIKSVGVAQADDVAQIERFEAVADMILLDSKPAPGALPGGSGHGFNHALVAGRPWRRPWLLAGGLTPETVREAADAAGAREVDVSSGVEARRGEKSLEKIIAFMAAARGDISAPG